MKLHYGIKEVDDRPPAVTLPEARTDWWGIAETVFFILLYLFLAGASALLGTSPNVVLFLTR